MDKIEFYCKLALEQRLSLKEISYLSNIEEKEIVDWYSALTTDDDLPYIFLFNIETALRFDQKEITKIKHKLKILSESEEKEELIKQLLYKTDLALEELPEYREQRFNDEDYMKISNYRLKYALSETDIARRLGIERKQLSKFESNKYVGKIKERIEDLNYFVKKSDRYHHHYVNKNKK